MRRAFVWTATAWFAMVTSGVPLPAGMPPDKFGAPFPCQSHACGCRSAAACWADCCCFTHEEKHAWARANGVTPPVGTPTFDPSADRSVAEGKDPPAKRSCCAKKVAPPAVSLPPRRSCCAAKEANCGEASCSERTNEDAAESEKAPAGVVLLQAMKCRGVASSWTGTGQPFVPPLAIEWTQETTVSAVFPSAEPAFASRRLRYVGPPG
ncbi:MAG TPA: hypothetical protein VGN57_05085 [Pirellulaceae bacterium]|nr:hypothetical protein [Pirellulaceae bacterium]